MHNFKLLYVKIGLGVEELKTKLLDFLNESLLRKFNTA
ncbi:hypothetical protein ADIWIN_2229 [Winogradskyella psychrotolerans RS-3]|uniref:Uncharacterized protein n=1 Tax=Winogradskyella psychrotolerans RS-3 TaxID=641526 RepID=S7VTU8_9FLAO|nr:hypothetical protein ADIWIN_2229 [Winogradskyella psychrotolerans RS-3]